MYTHWIDLQVISPKNETLRDIQKYMHIKRNLANVMLVVNQ